MSNFLNKLLIIIWFGYILICLFNLEYVDFSRYNIQLDGVTIFCVIIVLITCFFYFKVENKSLTLLTPDKVFIVFYVLMIYPGVVLLAEGDERQSIVVSQSLSIIIFILTVFFIKSFNHLYKYNLSLTIIKKHELANCEHKKITRFSVFCAILLIVFYIFSGNFNRSEALLGLVGLFLEYNTDSLTSVNSYRSEIYESVGFIVVLGNYISVIILPILGSFLVIEGNKCDNKFLKNFGFFVVFVAFIFNIGTGSRLLTMKIILYFTILFSFLNKINIKLLFKASFIVFVILITTTFILGRGNKVKEGFGPIVAQNSERAFSRLFLVKGASSLIVYDYYPKKENFEYGSTIYNSLLGNSDFKRQTIANKMFSYVTGGKKGTAGPQTFADFYANFGYSGQIIGSFFLAIILSFFVALIFKKKRFKSFDLAFVGYITLLIGYMGYSEFLSFKVGGLHVVLFLYFGYSIINAILNFKKRRYAKE